MEIYYSIYGLIFLYLFLMNHEGKVSFKTLTAVKRENKRVFVIELFARLSFLLLLGSLIIGFIQDKITFNVPALIMQVVSLALFFLAKRTMAKNWATNITNKQETLTTSGIFKISRNPVYLAYHLLFLSTLFVNWQLFLPGYIFFAISFHLLILEEKKYLKVKFGDTYSQYCTKTRRYL